MSGRIIQDLFHQQPVLRVGGLDDLAIFPLDDGLFHVLGQGQDAGIVVGGNLAPPEPLHGRLHVDQERLDGGRVEAPIFLEAAPVGDEQVAQVGDVRRVLPLLALQHLPEVGVRRPQGGHGLVEVGQGQFQLADVPQDVECGIRAHVSSLPHEDRSREAIIAYSASGALQGGCPRSGYSPAGRLSRRPRPHRPCVPRGPHGSGSPGRSCSAAGTDRCRIRKRMIDGCAFPEYRRDAVGCAEFP